MIRIKIIISFLLIYNFQISKGTSTDCITKTIEENVCNSDLIFIGKLKHHYEEGKMSPNSQSEIPSLNNGNSYLFEIIEVFKNTKTISEKKVKIFSNSFFWCEPHIPNNEKLLIFAKWREKEKKYWIYFESILNLNENFHRRRIKKAEQILNIKIIDIDDKEMDNKKDKWLKSTFLKYWKTLSTLLGLLLIMYTTMIKKNEH